MNMLALISVNWDIFRRTSLHQYRSAENCALIIELRISITLHSLTSTASQTRKQCMKECIPVSFISKFKFSNDERC
jgi:hypothetical protein